jgi:hypothetical protein
MQFFSNQRVILIMASKGPSEANPWVCEKDLGADVFKEAFGDIDEPKTGLLWLASCLYDTTAAVINTVTCCSRVKRSKPD